jgi:hypothetical protein
MLHEVQLVLLVQHRVTRKLHTHELKTVEPQLDQLVEGVFNPGIVLPF